jgi:predicted RNA polymerase sigma factor
MLRPLAASQARFRDDLALWQHALTRYPTSDRVCRQWANATAKVRGAAHGLAATDACIAHFGPSLFARNRAILLARLGRTDEARDTY